MVIMVEKITIPDIKLNGSTVTILFAIAYSWAPRPTSKLNWEKYILIELDNTNIRVHIEDLTFMV